MDGVEPQCGSDYESPRLERLGRVSEVTQAKEVGAADGTTFLGIDIGEVFS